MHRIVPFYVYRLTDETLTITKGLCCS